MKCSHCSVQNAEFKWHPALCADGRKRRTKYLCGICDMQLNRMMLEFFNDPKTEEKMAKYIGAEE